MRWPQQPTLTGTPESTPRVDDAEDATRLETPGAYQEAALQPTDAAAPGHTTVEGEVVEGKLRPYSGIDWRLLGISVLATAFGGALVGWLATGGRGWRGALIGAGAHTTLFLGGTAILGRSRLSGGHLLGLGAAAAISAGGTAWLFTQQRRKGVR